MAIATLGDTREGLTQALVYLGMSGGSGRGRDEEEDAHGDE